MHLVEASGLHPETPYDSVLPTSAQCEQEEQPDINRPLAGVARYLNVWTSFDLGLSRVLLHPVSPAHVQLVHTQDPVSPIYVRFTALQLACIPIELLESSQSSHLSDSPQ